MPHMKALFIAVVLLGFNAGAQAYADTVYQPPQAFIKEVLGETVSEGRLTLSTEQQKQAKSLLKSSVRQTGYTFWTDGDKRVWILQEIGKYQPITAGFVISERHIAQAMVLVYRESHGGEVHEPYFVDQFVGLSLTDKSKLNNRVDGISGATLSVNAMRKMAHLALFLDGLVDRADASPSP